MKVHELLKSATEILHSSQIAEPRREANSLLAYALKKDSVFLIAYHDYELSNEEQRVFNLLLERRAQREPFQYITGVQEFYGLDFIVTPDVLIPRPETELIAENGLEFLRDKKEPYFCEIGVGSGCISISLLYHNKHSTAIGLDISQKAIEIAKLNAEKHSVEERLQLEASDVFSALQDQQFDLIVSNPPYISFEDVLNLQPEVRDFEPQNALTDGGTGLSIIEKIILESPKFLKKGGGLMIEIGYDQSDEVLSMFAEEIWQSVKFENDLQGIPRMVSATLK